MSIVSRQHRGQLIGNKIFNELSEVKIQNQQLQTFSGLCTTAINLARANPYTTIIVGASVMIVILCMLYYEQLQQEKIRSLEDRKAILEEELQFIYEIKMPELEAEIDSHKNKIIELKKIHKQVERQLEEANKLLNKGDGSFASVKHFQEDVMSALSEAYQGLYCLIEKCVKPNVQAKGDCVHTFQARIDKERGSHVASISR